MLWLLGIPANKRAGCVSVGSRFPLRKKREIVRFATDDMEESIKIA
jgi:hypothetical protein